MPRYQSSFLTLHLTHAYAICYPWKKRKSNLAEKQLLTFRAEAGTNFWFAVECLFAISGVVRDQDIDNKIKEITSVPAFGELSDGNG